MKRIVKAAIGPDTEYSVIVRFNDCIGCDVELKIDARVDIDEDELLYIVQDYYADDLLSAEVVDFDPDSNIYDVEVTFDDQFSATEVYFVWASDEDEAAEDAIEEAKNDLEIIEYHEV